MLDYGVLQRFETTHLESHSYFISTRKWIENMSEISVLNMDIKIQMIGKKLNMNVDEYRRNLRRLRPDVRWS